MLRRLAHELDMELQQRSHQVRFACPRHAALGSDAEAGGVLSGRRDALPRALHSVLGVDQAEVEPGLGPAGETGGMIFRYGDTSGFWLMPSMRGIE